MKTTKIKTAAGGMFTICALDSEFASAGDAAAVAEIFIYGDIGPSWYGDSVEAAEFVKQLQTVEADELDVHINSYGGSVSDGLAIYNALKAHPAKVNIIVDGVAVSIASLISMAGDTVTMHSNTLMMIHAPWGGAQGNAQDLRKYADVLDKFAEAMASSYMNKSGMSHDDVMAMLSGEDDHWFTAEEAQGLGLCDEVAEEIELAVAGFDLQRFKVPAADAAQTEPKPAQPAAVIIETKTESIEMTEEEKKALQAKEREAVKAAETKRKTEMRAAFSPHIARAGVQALLDTCIDDMDTTPADANAKLLSLIGNDAAPSGAAYVVEDERDKRMAGMEQAICANAGLIKAEGHNEYRGHTLLELARNTLELCGVNAKGMSKMDMVGKAFAHGASDFPLLLSNTAGKAILKGYEDADESFQAWTSTGVLTDFKASSRAGLNAAPSLREVRAGAEYKYITIGEHGEDVQLATYGELFAINRQAIINDDLDAFTRIPRLLGMAAIGTVGDLVYAVLTANAAMKDGTALFHADHNNLLASAAIHTNSVDAMAAAMAKQKAGGKALNIRMANLIVPRALKGTALTVRDSQYEVTASNKNNTTPNHVAGTFEVHADARLDDTSPSNWYGAGDPNVNDTIEVSYLDGNQAPRLETQNGWTVDGVEFKVAIDAAVKALDFRALAKNPN